MFTRLVTVLVVGVLFTSAGANAQSERLTIPQALARGWTGWTTVAGSGQVPTISDVVTDADLIVRGIVGTPISYLSDDERDVYTDYPLSSTIIIHQSGLSTSRQPGVPVVTVTQLGGIVTIGKLKFTQEELGLPSLEMDSEGLFFLKRVGDNYHIVRTYYGAFRISNGTVAPCRDERISHRSTGGFP